MSKRCAWCSGRQYTQLLGFSEEGEEVDEDLEGGKKTHHIQNTREQNMAVNHTWYVYISSSKTFCYAFKQERKNIFVHGFPCSIPTGRDGRVSNESRQPENSFDTLRGISKFLRNLFYSSLNLICTMLETTALVQPKVSRQVNMCLAQPDESKRFRVSDGCLQQALVSVFNGSSQA